MIELLRWRNKERKRIEKKKKKLQQKRKEQMTKEMARSLNIEETPLKTDDDDKNQLDLDENPKLSSREKIEDLLDSNSKMLRKTFHHDQRGSVNTEMRQQRLKNRLLTHRGSYASSSVYSQARTEFSFHPSINYMSKWKPKYDDHHNHKKMWKRMHAENEKINRKKRLLSEQKMRDELAACTFTPKLVAKKKEGDPNEPLDVKHLSLRLYQYADKFKDKREQMKKKYDSERGEEIRFTPKLETAKANNELDIIRERKNVYDGLYEDYHKREQNKVKLKTLYEIENKKGNSKSEDDLLLLSVKKSSTIKGKHVNFYDTIGGKSSKTSTPMANKTKAKIHPKTFSANLYSEKVNSKSGNI